MHQARNTIEYRGSKKTDRLYEALCIIGAGLFCGCFVYGVLS